MEDLFKKAEQARAYWVSNSFDAYDFILLFPHDDIKLNNAILSAAKAKLAGTINLRIVVLSVIPVKKDNSYTTIQVSQGIIDALLLLYSMYEFTDKLIIASLQLPYGRKLKNMLNCNIDSEIELFKTIFCKIG